MRLGGRFGSAAARVPRPFGNSPHVRQGWEPHTNSYLEYGSGGALQYLGRTERYDPAWAYDLTNDFGKGKDAAESGGGAAVPAALPAVTEADVGSNTSMKRSKSPGTRLIYSDDGEIYVSPDHYDSDHPIGEFDPKTGK